MQLAAELKAFTFKNQGDDHNVWEHGRGMPEMTDEQHLCL